MSSKMSAPGSPISQLSQADPLPPGPSVMSSTGGQSSRRNNAWHDVLEICKKGFANKMSSMGQEILQDVRMEVEQNGNSLRQDVATMLESREKTSNVKLQDLQDKMVKVLDVAKTGYVDFGKLDLSPVVDEIRANETMHAETTRAMSQRLDESMVLISSTLERLSAKAEQEEARNQRLTERVQASEDQLQKVSESLLAQSQQTLDNIQKMSQASRQCNEMFTSQLQYISDQFDEPLDVDTQEIRTAIRDVKRVVNDNCNIVLTEISKIQQALNLDFVQIMSERPGKPEDAAALPPPAVVSVVDEFAPTVVEAITSSTLIGARRENPGTPRKTLGNGPNGGLKVKTRVREFFVQTDKAEEISKWTQTDPKMTQEKKAKPRVTTRDKDAKKDAPPQPKGGFNDGEALKKQARLALMTPQYNVLDEYHETGFFQRIAKSVVFDNLTLSIVLANALWMSIDTDLNSAAIITEALPVFQVVENLFCIYFFSEVLIRFMAFKRKLRAFKDSWFIFDATLVSLMVAETWLMPLAVLALDLDMNSITDLSTLRMIRMVKLLRLSRMAKLLRAVPELTIILKGIKFAARSVIVFFFLWVMIIYVFAIFLRQYTNGKDVGQQYFASVPASMNNLLLHGILPENREIIFGVGTDDPVLWTFIVFFFLLVSVTITYMLMGVLVEVVGVIASTEKEGITVSYLASEFREKMEQLNYHPEVPLTKFEFQKMLVEPEITLILTSVGVDVIVLVDSLDMLYEDLAKHGEDTLEFQKILDIVLNMRGANPATVKDVKEQLRLTKSLIKGTQWAITEKMSAEFNAIQLQLKELRDEALKRDEFEVEEEDIVDEGGGEEQPE